MDYKLNQIFFLLLISTALSAILSCLSIRIAPFIQLMDIPGSAIHKIHQKPTPITGGIVLILSLTIISIIFIPQYLQYSMGIIVGGWIIFIFGLWDDFKNLSAWIKLFGQILAVIVLINLGIQINIFNSVEFMFQTNTILDNWMNIGLTVLWILTITNAFNFIDSIDGLAVGLGALSLIFYLIVSLASMQYDLACFCAILLGTAVALYFFNSKPAYLFLGDSGSQTLGFTLAAIAIIYSPKSFNQMSSWFAPILFFSVPLFDFYLVILSRIRRGKHIYKAANDHIYHRLIKFNFLKNRAVLILHIGSLILSMIGYLCLDLEYHFANIIFIICIITGIGFFVLFEYFNTEIQQHK